MDIAKILERCPKGMKLYSPMLGEVKFKEINNCESYPISITVDLDNKNFYFCSDGRFINRYENSECLLFPSKNQRDWNKFKIPREDLKKGTPCICSDTIESLRDIKAITLRFYSENGRCYAYDISNDLQWKYIIPIDKFNFNTMTFKEKDDYGTK